MVNTTKHGDAWRVRQARCTGRDRTVIDGPFTEAKKLEGSGAVATPGSRARASESCA